MIYYGYLLAISLIFLEDELIVSQEWKHKLMKKAILTSYKTFYLIIYQELWITIIYLSNCRLNK